MIRMIQSSSSGHAKAYFSDALVKSDYYLNDQELQGRFAGLMAERLGIDGKAEKQTFFALCENYHPKSGKPLTPRTREDRTVGYDINFHAPKSVSLVHVLSKDNHIMQAFQESVDETMKDIEADAMTRVRKKGAYEDRKTGELVWADFTHQTARPVDGSVPDPHLHSHCFVFNATWDEQEKGIKAVQFREINRDMPYYQARFHKTLSDKLIDRGYQIRRTDKSFEVVGVPKAAIELFSKRTNEIGEFAKAKGITDDRRKSELGARTRSKKQKGLTMEELKAGWKQQIKDSVNYSPGEEQASIRFGLPEVFTKELAVDCVDYALQHSFERASVVPERRLLATAYKHSIGKRNIELKDITTDFKQHKAIIKVKEKTRSFCTTIPVLSEEKRMVTLARNGQGRFHPLYDNVPALKLNAGQNAAIEHVLTTTHQVSIIRGAAGSGKTKLMSVAVPLFEKAGKQVMVVAPTAEASRGVLKSEGFENAETVAKLLIDKKMQEKLKNQVLWVDEAGLLGTKDMTAILELAGRQNARVILGGDTRQHSSVVRGDALRILNTVAGIKTAEVNKIMRQKNVDYRAAVEDLSKGDVYTGFVKLGKMGSIRDVDPLKPNEELVTDYIAAVKKGKSALIVSPTHKQGEAVTGEVRERLRSSGLIGKKELSAIKLSNLNFTEAQKSDWRNFERLQIIQFNQNAFRIKRGSMWRVTTVGENTVGLIDDSGNTRTLPQNKPGIYDVYNVSFIGLAKGDKVKITRNGFDEKKKRLNNGQALTVTAVSKSGDIELQNDISKASFKLNKEFGHIDHAYCSTSHSAQGKTVDEVFISQPAATFTATDAKQFYVSVSRGKDKATIYTDDRAALLEYASEIGDRQSALELVGNNKVHMDYVHQLEREKLSVTPQPEYNKQPKTINKEPDYEPGF